MGGVREGRSKKRASLHLGVGSPMHRRHIDGQTKVFSISFSNISVTRVSPKDFPISTCHYLTLSILLDFSALFAA